MASPDEKNTLLSPQLHPAKPLPFELVQHVAIFFEEKLHTQALSILLNSLSAYPDASKPIFIPSPQHLALAATFLVHPSTTARPKTAEEEEAPNVSLRLLRLVNSLFGPLTAQFSTAFLFTHFETSRHGGRRHNDDATRSTPVGERKLLNLDRDIDTDLAQSASVWSRAEDFWHAVGWTFNCAVLHPARWERWRIWLEFMCEVLEDDWNERLKIKEKDPSKNEKVLRESLIVHYIKGSSVGFGRNRRILRAIFADGGPTAVNEFREVFHNELKLSRKKDPKEKDRKRREEAIAVNIDEEQYGDFYMASDDEESSSGRESKRPRRSIAATTNTASKRSKRKTTTKANPDKTALSTPDMATAASLLGDITALALRQRLLHLLSTVSQSLPSDFMDLQDLYHLFVENIRPLPLPIYQSFVSPLALPYFSPAAQTTLCEYLLFRMRENAAPATDEDYLNQSKLETCFLPYAAASSSLSDNAKMSITLEALVILLVDSHMLRVTDELKYLVKQGIIKRAEKAQAETRKNQLARLHEDLEWSWLCESAERLTFLVEELVPSSAANSESTGS
ncbi:hypothetical protein BJX61DRAFT_505437 [Aspergillus egyptiacus]|nr:hypothetical protein BJX61DRAFT_505437 [Aspergillus egyptiacus]